MASMRAVVTGGPHFMLNLFNEKTPILLYMKIRRYIKLVRPIPKTIYVGIDPFPIQIHTNSDTIMSEMTSLIGLGAGLVGMLLGITSVL